MTDYYLAMERAIDFIEKNLAAPISVEDVSRNAFQSRWHFQRIFRYVTGYSVYSYIKKRRLAEAGNELLLTKKKIIDIAFKYQYRTPESFLRAFRMEYSANPSDYRKGREHRAFQRIVVSRDSDRKHDDREAIPSQVVVRNEAFFIGRKYRTTLRQDRNERDIPVFWKEFFARNTQESIPDKVNQAAIGIYCNWDIDEAFDVIIGSQVGHMTRVPDGMVGYKAAAAKYMVFTVSGNTTEEILAAWKYIYQVWMPETGYDRGFGDDFDLFDDRFMRAEKPESEIFIPMQ